MVTPSLALSNEGIFLNYSSSKKIVSDLKFYTVNYPKIEQKYTICTEQYLNANKNLASTEQLLSGCNKDKDDLKGVSKEFQDKFSDCSNKLDKCEKEKPSRVTWFAIGATTTAIITTILAILFTRK